jgi:hypothetical protein
MGAAAYAAVGSAPVSVTAVTHVTSRPDNGHGVPPVWAYDKFARTLTVRLDSPQPASGVPEGDLAYAATITDAGTFATVVGAPTPNQAVPGAKISHGVTGTINGTYSLTVYAPAADALTGTVPSVEDDNFAAPLNTTGNWPSLAFATTVGVVANGGPYDWTYARACESWADSSANGDGNLAGDGNITGRICPVPVLFGGHATYLANTRENVFFKSTRPTWVMFRIYGPGPINNHIGWVLARAGGVENVGTYLGLLFGHTYVAVYEPVTGPGSFREVPGARSGAVDFIS